MKLALICVCAVILDRWLGEPRRWHPLVGFGNLAQQAEQWFYGPPQLSAQWRRLRGGMALMCLIFPAVLGIWLLSLVAYGEFIIEIGILYLALGATSLAEHARAVANALYAHNLPMARQRVGLMVSRDTGTMNQTQVSTAAVESVLENGCDAVFGALFWFAVAGAPGVVLYRLVNTLDAMWGYRTTRYLQFGWAAARLDDILNCVPARLTALSYTLLGQQRLAWRCWRLQASAWQSPNAGSVMAAGAGALGVSLGGAASYHGQWIHRPSLGAGLPPGAFDIDRAVKLMNAVIVLWLLGIAIGGWLLA